MSKEHHPDLKEPVTMPQVDFQSPVIQPVIKVSEWVNRGKVANIQLPEGFQLRKFQLEHAGRSFVCHCVESVKAEGELPGLLYFHGGGFLLPLQTVMFEKATYFAEHLNCRVFLPEYTLTTDEPFPVALEEAAASLQFVLNHHAYLEVAADKILLYGESAGGCLAASLTRLHLDKSGARPLAGLALIYPVLDNVRNYPSISKYESSAFSAEPNASMWDLYLAAGWEQHPLKEYAVPAHNRNFTDFPPVYVEAAEEDILRDEARAYAARLEAAGIPVKLEVVPGAYHAYDNDHSSPLVQRMMGQRVQVFRQFLSDKEDSLTSY